MGEHARIHKGRGRASHLAYRVSLRHIWLKVLEGVIHVHIGLGYTVQVGGPGIVAQMVSSTVHIVVVPKVIVAIHLDYVKTGWIDLAYLLILHHSLGDH